MRILALIFFIFIKLSCFGQNDSNHTPMYDSTIVVSLSSYSQSLNQSQLDSGFVIHTKDSTYKIIKFCIVYTADVDSNVGLQQLVFEGNKAYIDKKYPKLYYFESPLSNFISIDKILVEKSGLKY